MATQVHECRILGINEIAPETRVIRLSRPPGFELLPGQFLSLLLEIDGQNVNKPYTVTSDPEDRNFLDICLNRITGGRASNLIFEMKPGATLRCTGPWGTFTLETAPPRQVVLIADGTGIAAIRPLLKRALRTNPQAAVALWQNAESEAHMLFSAEIEALAAAHPSLAYHRLTGRLFETIESRYAPPEASRQVEIFICGVGDLVPRLRDLLRAAGYERRAVHYERW